MTKRDILILSGLVLIGIGLWMVHPEYMFLGIGALIFMAGFFSRDEMKKGR